MVIAHSPLIQGPGMLPHRIVIRDMGDQYVVHMEIHEPDKKPWYHQGNYIPKRDGEKEALWRAWEVFEKRSRLALGMDPPATDRLKRVVDIAASIINSLLPDDNEDRTEQVEDDYQLKSDLDTFEHYTSRSLYEPLGEGEDDE